METVDDDGTTAVVACDTGICVIGSSICFDIAVAVVVLGMNDCICIVIAGDDDPITDAEVSVASRKEMVVARIVLVLHDEFLMHLHSG